MTDIIFDEGLYPIAWRLNSEDCRLSPDEKRKIVLLNGDESEKLWDQFFPFDMLMSIKPSQCRIIEKMELDFNEAEKSAIFFREKLRGFSDILFFWGRRAAAIVISSDVFIKAWDDFFYPSDESSVIYIPNTKNIIFSYEEIFFYAEILK